MKRWTTWVAWLASTGLGLGLAAAAVPPQEVPPAGPPAAGNRNEQLIESLKAAMANRGDRKHYTDPSDAARRFLAALKEKDLKRMAEATALHAITESRNQELFRLILAQKLDREDLDELAQRLSGFEVAGRKALKNLALVDVVMTRRDGNGVMKRTLTMRHEKAGWKLQDIGGKGEREKPIILSRTGRGGNRQ